MNRPVNRGPKGGRGSYIKSFRVGDRVVIVRGRRYGKRGEVTQTEGRRAYVLLDEWKDGAFPVAMPWGFGSLVSESRYDRPRHG